MKEQHCPDPSKRTDKMKVHIISSLRSKLCIYINYANLKGIQYKAKTANELKSKKNIRKHHKGKFRLHSTYGYTGHFHTAQWWLPASSGSLSLNKLCISSCISQRAGGGMVLERAAVSPGQIPRSWPPVQHHLLGTQTLWILPAPAFVPTCPKHDTRRKCPPPCFSALLFSKYEVINHHRLIRLLLEHLAAQRALQKAIGYTESWHFKVLFKK